MRFEDEPADAWDIGDDVDALAVLLERRMDAVDGGGVLTGVDVATMLDDVAARVTRWRHADEVADLAADVDRVWGRL